MPTLQSEDTKEQVSVFVDPHVLVKSYLDDPGIASGWIGHFRRAMLTCTRQKHKELLVLIKSISFDEQLRRQEPVSKRIFGFRRTSSVEIVQTKRSSSASELQLVLLRELIQSGRHFSDPRLDEEVLAELWGIVREIVVESADAEGSVMRALQNCLIALAEHHSDSLFLKCRSFLRKSDNIALIKGLSCIKPKIFPEEALESTMKLMEFMAEKYHTVASAVLKDAYACLLKRHLLHIRSMTADDFVHIPFQRLIGDILDKSLVFDGRAKAPESAYHLSCAALCLAGRRTFHSHFASLSGTLLARVRDNPVLAQQSISSFNALLWTYYYRYNEAWATILDKTDNLLQVVFPESRKLVLGCEDAVDGVVQLVVLIARKLPNFALNEVIKRLVAQGLAQQKRAPEYFPFDRVLIGCLAFAHFVRSVREKGKPLLEAGDLEFVEMIGLEEIGNVADLDLKSVASSIRALINGSVKMVLDAVFLPDRNLYRLDLTKSKQTRYLSIIIETYWRFLEPDVLVPLLTCNSDELAAAAAEGVRKLFNCGAVEDQKALAASLTACAVGQLIYDNQSSFTRHLSLFDNLDIRGKDSFAHLVAVLDFFTGKFEVGASQSSSPMSGKSMVTLENCDTFKNAIVHLLEYLQTWAATWSSASSQSTKPIPKAELDHYGHIVDTYLSLDESLSAIMKEAFLERQGRRNFLTKSWGSLVGYKRNKRETVDFLLSLLEHSHCDLRLRIIQSFSFLAPERLAEFMKRVEKFRREVSYDLVNLNYDNTRKNRRFEQLKTEVTVMCSSFLAVVKREKAPERLSMAPLRLIVRHVAELFYFLIKVEAEDAFLGELRLDFLKLLRLYCETVCETHVRAFSPQQRAALLPHKFQCELWATLAEWFERAPGSAEERMCIAECLSLLAIGLLEQEPTKQGLRHESVMDWISRLSASGMESAAEQAEKTIGNALLTAGRENLAMLFEGLIEEALSTAMDQKIKLYLSGVDRACTAIKGRTRKEQVFVLVASFWGSLDGDLHRLAGGILAKAFAVESLHRVAETEGHLAPDVFNEVLYRVAQSKKPQCQRRLIQSLRPWLSKVELSEPEITRKVVDRLFLLTFQLLELMEQELVELWNTLARDHTLFTGVLVEWLVKALAHGIHRKVAGFVLSAAAKGQESRVLERLLVHLHPYWGFDLDEPERSLAPAVMILLEENVGMLDRLSFGRVLQRAIRLEPETTDTVIGDESCVAHLLKWATQCPCAEVSLMAWYELRFAIGAATREQLEQLLAESRVFLQHLVAAEGDKFHSHISLIFSLYQVIVFEAQHLSADSLMQISLTAVSVLKTVQCDEAQETLRFIVGFDEIWAADADCMLNDALSGLLLAQTRGNISSSHMAAFLERVTETGRLDLGRFQLYLLAALPGLLLYFEGNLATGSKRRANADALSGYDGAISYLGWMLRAIELLESTEALSALRSLLIAVMDSRSWARVDFYKRLAQCVVDLVEADCVAEFIAEWTAKDSGIVSVHQFAFLVVDLLRLSQRKPLAAARLARSLCFWEESFVLVGPCFEFLSP